MRLAHLLFMAAVLFGAATLGDVASAKTSKQKAKQLFRQGNKLYNKGKVEEALAKFRQARELYPSYKIDLNIASALNELGRPTEAAETYEMFLRRGESLAPRKIVRAARSSLEALRARLGRVRISCPEDGATVKMNRADLGQTPLRKWVYVEPGTFEFEVCKAGFTCHNESVELKAGDARELVMPLTAEAPLPKAKPVPAAVAETPAEEVPTVSKEAPAARDWRSTTGWITLGVGGASLVTGIIFGAMVSSKSSEHDKAVEDGKTYGELQEIADAGKRYEKIELATLIVGGVAVAAGGGLLLWHWLGKKPGASAESAVLVPFSTGEAHGLAGLLRF